MGNALIEDSRDIAKVLLDNKLFIIIAYRPFHVLFMTNFLVFNRIKITLNNTIRFGNVRDNENG